MSRFKSSKSIAAESMWPLLALARARMSEPLPRAEGNSLYLELDDGSALDASLDNQGLRLCLTTTDGEIAHEADVAAWGDQYSDAFWFPFGPFEELELPEEHRQQVEVHEIVSRTNELLGKVTFYDREPVVDRDGREAAAIDYLRLTSGVTEPWIIAMAAPHELILEGSSIGGGHGLLLCFGELPPGLADLGECALIEETPGSPPEWRMRPVMCVFDNDLAGVTTDASRLRLTAMGFTSEEIEQLDRVVNLVRSEHAAEEETEASDAYC